jgi:uncharacterized membrane protein
MTMNTDNEPHRRPGALASPLRLVVLGIVFVWFAVGGVAHFVFTKSELSIMPPYIPWPLAAVYVSGVFELLGAIGILVPRTRRAAGIGLFLLTIAVTPANVYMLQNAEAFHIARWILIARLYFQVVLLAMIWWSTSKPKSAALATG